MPEHAELHRQLEQVFDSLMCAVYSEDPITLRAEWANFERVLRDHLDQEERELIPGFAPAHPEEARAILREHQQIRTTLEELGLMLDLHLLRDQLVNEFRECLRRHAAREERWLIPWRDSRTAVHSAPTPSRSTS